MFDITVIIEAVFALLAAIITAIVIPYIKKARPRPPSRLRSMPG